MTTTTTVPASMAAGRLFLDAARREHEAFASDPTALRRAGASFRLALLGGNLLVSGELDLSAALNDKDQARVARIVDGELSADQIEWQLDRVDRQYGVGLTAMHNLLAGATYGWVR
jgi:hypothetical protein